MNTKDIEEKVEYYEIDLDSVLWSMEGGIGRNPNCYEYTGKIRAMFREAGAEGVFTLKSYPYSKEPIIKVVKTVTEGL